MKKTILAIIALIFIIIAIKFSQACTPSACPAGYADNGTSCTSDNCTRECYMWSCGTAASASWTEVHSDTTSLLIKKQDDFTTDTNLNSYTATDTTKCYKFVYDGPDSESCIQLNLNESASPPASCDSAAIGGLKDDTNPTSPWFSDISGESWLGPEYLGDVGHASIDYMMKLSRAHVDDGEGTSSAYKQDLMNVNQVYCANNSDICSDLGIGYCSANCFNKATKLRIIQGFFEDVGTDDQTLYDANGCGSQYVNTGNGNYYDMKETSCGGTTGFYVYSAPADKAIYDNQNCEKANEPPNATNVKVLPEDANAGQDLICNYTYNDTEGYEERDSTYEWWKNGVNQSINYQILGKGNLTPDDGWYCKVTPSDGLANGTKVQSSNTVNISSTVQNPIMYVEDTKVWNATGYFGDEETVLNLNQEIESALDSCSEDAEGYCNISLTFSSDAIGLLNLTDLEIFYKFPDPTSSSITISSLSSIYSTNNRHIFQFIILNNGDTTLTDINWTIDFGDTNSAESIYKFNLTSNEDIFVFVEHNYTDNQSYTVTANAYAGALSASKQTTVGGESDLQITSFNELYSMGREKVWEFAIKNNAGTNITGINWNITGTDAVISSIYSFNLTPNETIRVYVHENLTNYQDYTITAKAFTDSTSGTGTLNTKGKELEVSNIKTLYTNGLTKILEFLVTNTYSSTITNINWSLYTGESTINAIYPFNLTSWENIRVLIENNYSGSGNKALNFSVKSSSAYDDSENKNITIT